MGSMSCDGREKRTFAMSATPMNFLRMLRNSFSLEESSPLVSVAAMVEGVDRFGVDGLEVGSEPTGVVVPEGCADDGAAEAILLGQQGLAIQIDLCVQRRNEFRFLESVCLESICCVKVGEGPWGGLLDCDSIGKYDNKCTKVC